MSHLLPSLFVFFFLVFCILFYTMRDCNNIGLLVYKFFWHIFYVWNTIHTGEVTHVKKRGKLFSIGYVFFFLFLFLYMKIIKIIRVRILVCVYSYYFHFAKYREDIDCRSSKYTERKTGISIRICGTLVIAKATI